jgi:signal transduction histidine kinase/DNA-binding response OmpR family regulator
MRTSGSLARPAKMSSTIENADSLRAPKAGAPRVLVVDDDDDLRSLLVEVLTEAGYAVSEARGGHEAIDEAMRVEPHVLLLDLRLPGRSGVEVYEEVVERGLHAPAVLMSAAHTVSDVADAHGIAGYLQKPFGIRELLDKVAQVYAQPSTAIPVAVPTSSGLTEPLPSFAQELRAMYALTADLASALTLEEVRVALSRWTHDCVGADVCSLALTRGDSLELIEATSASRDTSARWRTLAHEEPLPITHAIRHDAPIFLETRDETLAHFPAMGDLTSALSGMRAMAVLPLRAPRRDVIGALGLGFRESRTFDGQARAFLYALAQQCAIALERARMYAAEQLRRHEAQAAERRRAVLAEMNRLLDRTQTDLHETLRLVVEQIAEAIGDLCVLRRVCASERSRGDGGGWSDGGTWGGDGDGEQMLEVVAVHHVDPQALALMRALFASMPQRAGEGMAGKVIRSKRGMLVPVINPELARNQARSMYLPYLEHVGMHSLIQVPLVVRDRVLGTLAVSRDRPGRPYTEADLHFLEAIADRAAWAIDNARLHDLAELSVQAREHVLATVSHDLKSPIQVLRLCADLLRTQPDQAGNVARRLERTADQMIRLVDELLRAVKVDSARAGHLDHEPRRVLDLVRHTIQLVEPLALARAMTLGHDVDNSLYASCNASRVERVLANLLGNAIEHTPGGGSVRVTAEPYGRDVCISVTDTGPGIPAEYRERIFEPYWSKSPDGSRRGSGLGLAIAREIVEEHGGRIWLESKHEPGTGSMFRFTLPAARPPASSSHEDEAP